MLQEQGAQPAAGEARVTGHRFCSQSLHWLEEITLQKLPSFIAIPESCIN